MEKLKANQERMSAYANMNTRNIQNKATKVSSMTDEEREKGIKNTRKKYKSGKENPRSMMTKANMVKNYNEKNNKYNN